MEGDCLVPSPTLLLFGGGAGLRRPLRQAGTGTIPVVISGTKRPGGVGRPGFLILYSPRVEMCAKLDARI